MFLSLIAAVSENNVIGNKGKLPWSLPADLKRFRELTEGHSVIMGRKTFESIGHPLPRRRNIVVTRQRDLKIVDCEVVGSLKEAFDLVRTSTSTSTSTSDEVFVIGGAEIYRQALPLAHRIYLTLVHAKVEGDAFFPEVHWEEWREVKRERHEADKENIYACTFLLYKRR